jgi:hypothetical protein
MWERNAIVFTPEKSIVAALAGIDGLLGLIRIDTGFA